MTKGIYQYEDVNTGEVIYIGKDSNIGENKRYKDHLYKSNYNSQPFNRIIQNNPNRYEYSVICEYPDLTDDELNYLEIQEIMKHKFLYDELPKFNFTIGGDGKTGYKHTEETKRKLSELNKGKPNPHTKEWNKKIGEAQIGEKNHRWKDYARIHKNGFKSNGKQVYAIRFNGKKLKQSISIDKLVKWFEDNYPNEELIIE